MLSILISSTFNDMQAERDIIRTRVEPALRKVAEKYGQSVRLLDLRWGVNTANMSEEEASQKVLDVCLDEIDRCDGYMVCLLGNRYGWVPDYSKVDSVQRHGVLMNEPMSVTELEIQYGVLQRNQGEKAIVLFRDEISDLPEELYEQYNDASGDCRQKVLKEKLENLEHTNCMHYRLNSLPDGEFGGLDLFAEILLDQLTELVQRVFCEAAAKTAVQLQEKKFASMIDETFSSYLPVPELEKALETFCGKETPFLVVSGAMGMGKTAFAARVCANPPEGVQIIPYFCGINARKTEPLHILQHFIGILDETYRLEKITINEAKDQLSELLWRQKQALWLVIDGIEQIETEEENRLHWIPQNLPPAVRFIVTASSEEKSWQQLEEFYQVQYVKILPLANPQDFMSRQLASRGKEIPGELLEKVAKHSLSGSYFFCDLAMRMLMLINRSDFQIMRQEGDGIDTINDYIRRKLEDLPDTMEAMAFLFLFDCGAQIVSGNVGDYLIAIACSPIGLRAQDLQALFPEQWDEPEFAYFKDFLEGYLIEDENGCYRLRMGVLQSAGTRAADNNILGKIAAYLRTLPDYDPVKAASSTFLFLYLNWMDDVKRLILNQPEHAEIKGDILRSIRSHRSLIKKILNDDEMLQWFLENVTSVLTDRVLIRITAEILAERHLPEKRELQILLKQTLAELYMRCKEKRKAYTVRKELLSLLEDRMSAAKCRVELVGCAFADNEDEEKEIETMLDEAMEVLDEAEPCLASYHGEFYRILIRLQDNFGYKISGIRNAHDLIYLREHAKSRETHIETLLFAGLQYLGNMERKITVEMTGLMLHLCTLGNEMLDSLEKKAENAEQYGELLLLMMRAMKRLDSHNLPLEGNFENETAKEQLYIFRAFRLLFGKRVCEVLTENMKDAGQTYANKMLAKLRILRASFVETLEEKTELLEKGCRVLRRYFTQDPLSEYAEELAEALLNLAECYLDLEQIGKFEQTLEEWGAVALGSSKYHMEKALEACRRYPDEEHRKVLESARGNLESAWEEYGERLLLQKDYYGQLHLQRIFAAVFLARTKGKEHAPNLDYPKQIYAELNLIARMDNYARDDSLDELKKRCLPRVLWTLLHTVNRLFILLERKLDEDAKEELYRPEGYYPVAIGFTERYIQKLNELQMQGDIRKEQMRLALRLARLQYCHAQLDPEREEVRLRESLDLLETVRECITEEEVYPENWMYEELSVQNLRYWTCKIVCALGNLYFEKGQYFLAVKYYRQMLDLCLLLKGTYPENPAKETVIREYSIQLIPRLYECIEKLGLWDEAKEIANKASVLL